MKLEKYDPTKVSRLKKTIYTFLVILIAPYTLLLSLFFVQYIWTGRPPFKKNTGKLTSYKKLKDENK
jgi:hypothetical protein